MENWSCSSCHRVCVQAPGRKKIGPPLRGRGNIQRLGTSWPLFLQSELFVCVWILLHLHLCFCYVQYIDACCFDPFRFSDMYVKEISLLVSLTWTFFRLMEGSQLKVKQGGRERDEPRVADSKKERRTLKLLFFLQKKRKAPYLFICRKPL